MARRDPDNALEYYRSGQDLEQSVADARREIEQLLSSTEDSIDKKIERFLLQMEPLLDGPGSNPMEVVAAGDLLEREMHWRMRFEDATASQRLLRRVKLNVALARGWHCAGNSDKALERALAAHCITEAEAGSREKLFELLSAPEPNIVAECMSRTLGILAAALRRAEELGPTARRYWPQEIRALADALMPGLDPERAIAYAGSESRVQILYLMAEEGDPLDAERIRAHHRFDQRVRLTDHRGMATVPLREVAVAKYFGDDATAEEQGEVAIEKLEDAQMERHLRVIDENGYID